MEKLKTLPLEHLISYLYPSLYPVHVDIDWQNEDWPKPLQLTFANIERNGVYLLDTYDSLYLYICKSVNPQWLVDVLNVSQWGHIPDDGDSSAGITKQAKTSNSLAGLNPVALSNGTDFDEHEAIIPLPENDNDSSTGLRSFIDYLLESRPIKPHFVILR